MTKIDIGHVERTIRAKDIYEVLRLPVQGLLAWTLPEAAWQPLARIFGWFDTAMKSRRTRRDTARIAVALNLPWEEARRIAIETRANKYLLRFQYLRSWRFGGWSPTIDVLGRQHVAEARAKGAGIIFWAGNFSFNDIVAKMAWHQMGLAVSHFSRPGHGFSITRFGINYLNALKRGIENRYIGERIIADQHQTRGAFDLIRKRLKENGAVSLRVGYRGRHVAGSDFLGGSRLTLATAPLFLAETTGATLLPVFTLRTGVKRFEVTIGAPLVVPKHASGEPDYPAAIRIYGNMLTPYVVRQPGQWGGWAREIIVGNRWRRVAPPVSTGFLGCGNLGWFARLRKRLDRRNVRVLVRPGVKNVGLQDWMVRRAKDAGVIGWVRNRSDGYVEAVFEGDRHAVAALIAQVRRGPQRAKISEVIVQKRRAKCKKQDFRRRKTVAVDSSLEDRAPRRG